MATPMMKQYHDIKSKHPDEILLFRMGDFYETFFDDARIVSNALGIALTSREKNKTTGDGIPLAGFPYHALDSYLTRLVRAGFRIAICEQVEDPKEAKGIVQREVVEVITPGTLISGSALDEKKTILLCSAVDDLKTHRSGITTCDLSTGEVRATEVDISERNEELSRIAPVEILIHEGSGIIPPPGCDVTEIEAWKFDLDTSIDTVKRQFKLATLEGIDLKQSDIATRATGALLSYICETKKSVMSHLGFSGFYRRDQFMVIDRSTAKSLNLIEAPEGEESSILADATDSTVTSAGARMWRRWLLAPPVNSSVIIERHKAVEVLTDRDLSEKIQSGLYKCTDLQRQAGKLGSLKSNPRDLKAIANTAEFLPGFVMLLEDAPSRRLNSIAQIDTIQDIAEEIDKILIDEPPFRINEGGMIKPGIDPVLDELRDIHSGGKEWIRRLEVSEREKTGIPKLTIGFNRVFGYYIEVTRSYLDRIPEYFERKQTLVNAERFITPELKEMERRVLNAEEEILEIEIRIFCDLRTRIAESVERIKATGLVLAELDVLTSLGVLADSQRYMKPEISETICLEITEGKHPVLDIVLPRGECVPNDVILNCDRRILTITGPNMAGKSTYLREAALLLIIAQAGSFVPAAKMKFSPCDRIFTRIGSSDRIISGQSTFLVEMAEAAILLNSSTARSLAILDEVGRGTSTFDGLSLAWAIVEFLHDHPVHRPMVMFATHYHELTALAGQLDAVFNLNVAVRETGKEVIFLYRVMDGGADRSYGIHVASMAGVPDEVVKRAGRILADLEKGKHLEIDGLETHNGIRESQLELPLQSPEHPVLEEIRNMDPDELTPRRALELIYILKKMLE